MREEQRQLRYLEGIAARPGPHFEVVRVVRARVPVLRLRYRGQLEVDLSLGEDFSSGVAVDAAVRELLEASVDAGARRFVRLVKMFAKAHGLVDAYGGFLNSVSWVFLALAFLQAESCLPAHSQLTEGASRRALWPVRPTLALFVRFFRFVRECARHPHQISVASGQVKASSPRTWSGNTSAPLLVEHPTKPGHNIARCLSAEGWAKTAAQCMRAHKRLALALEDRDGGGARGSGCEATVAWLLRGAVASAGSGDTACTAQKEGVEEPKLKYQRLAFEPYAGAAAVSGP